MATAANQVGDVYYQVIDDVIENARQVFLDEGLDESLLTDLQTLWIEKLQNQKTIVTNEPKVEDEDASFYPHNKKKSIAQTDGAVDERHSTIFNTAQQTLNQPTEPSIVGISFESMIPEQQPTTTPSTSTSACDDTTQLSKNATASSSQSSDVQLIPQLDGNDDDDDDDDDADDDWQNGLESPEASDDEDPDVIVICAFEKIHRTRGKYKANLKNVIMQMDGKDYMFSKATGEWDW